MLSDDLRLCIGEIGSAGFPALADCYLRFRLSRSDVERFLALMDGFECLAKFSILALTAFEPHEHSPENGVGKSQPFARELEKGNLGFGAWTASLAKRVDDFDVNPAFGCLAFLRDFWRSGLSSSQNQLVRQVAERSNWNLPVGNHATQLDWIKWITNLRNASKGHGVVSDASVRNLWHPLHESFLFMAAGLKELTSMSTLTVSSANHSLPLRGWRRDLISPDAENSFRNELVSADLELPAGATASLGKYVLVRGTAVFIWDGLAEKGVQRTYLDYLSGARFQR